MVCSLFSPCCLCVYVTAPPFKTSEFLSRLHETWYAHHYTWAHPSHQSVTRQRLGSFVGPRQFLHFLNPIHSRQDSLDGDQPARPLPTYRTTQTQNKHTETSMRRVGFKPITPEFERAKKVSALDRNGASGMPNYERGILAGRCGVAALALRTGSCRSQCSERFNGGGGANRSK
jgi:hypothetical protein